MGTEVVRFLHASDFRLEQPMQGLGDVPSSMRQLLIDAPLDAARRVFDAALAEGVTFVVLSGNLVDLKSAEPRSIVFLLEQFERLAQNKIDVYWAGGQIDSPPDWPAAAALPDNVYFFSTQSPEEFTVDVDGEPIAALIGLSASRKAKGNRIDWTQSGESPVSIGVVNGSFDKNRLISAEIDYWALGGQAYYETVCDQDPTAIYTGAPQGRSPEDTGRHGCQVIQILESGEIEARLVETDSARWRHLNVRAPKDASKQQFEDVLGEQLLNLAAEAGDRLILASVDIQCGAGLGNPKLARQLTEWARKEFGGPTTPLWVADIRFTPPKELPSQWSEEDSILGDFLRTVNSGGQTKHESDLEQYIPGGQAGESLKELVASDHGTEVNLQFREAAKLGVDLLRGEDAA